MSKEDASELDRIAKYVSRIRQTRLDTKNA